MSTMRRFLATAAAVTVCSGVARAELAPARRAAAEAALTRGLAWLQAAQQTNGVWSNAKFPALTALPLWTFVNAGRPEHAAVVDRAVAFLVTQARADGGIYADVPGQKGGGLGNYNTAIAMTVLHATGRRELDPLIRKARTYVASAQYLGDDEYRGGFGYDKATGRAYTDLLNTHYALGAMRATQAVEDSRPAGEARADVDWNAALSFAGKLQNGVTNSDADNAGGFTYNPNDPKAGTLTNAAGTVFLRSYGSITYAGLLAMIYAQAPREDPRIRSAVDYVARHWTLDENPGMGQQGLFFYFNVMARALAAARLESIPRAAGGAAINWRDELIAKVTALQQADGSWANANNRFWENDPVLATSYALLTLQHALGMQGTPRDM